MRIQVIEQTSKINVKVTKDKTIKSAAVHGWFLE